MVLCIGKTRGLEPLVLGGDLGEGIIAIRNKPEPTEIKAPALKTGENGR
jgi:hypothetical protein